MRICAISDLHNRFPELEPHDLTIIAGDCIDGNIFLQAQVAQTLYKDWLEDIPSDDIILIAGNHSFLFQELNRHLPFLSSNVRYLKDEETTVQGLRIWGTPWTPVFGDWAFNATSEEQEHYFSMIPEGLDILVSHGPPLGILDANAVGECCGSSILRKHIERAKPKIVVCGHIHESRGEISIDGITYKNVSYLDGNYAETRKPHYFTI